MYFTNAKWLKGWIVTTEDLFHKQWARFYKPTTVPKPRPPKATEAQKNKYFDKINNFGKNPVVTDDLSQTG
jgi:hypothetical protein